ncbi:hypothetical protein [Roseinatronobacter monicus]|uniref:Uncharacterized protein n=1 Tax=Roseinatronobacter monicus TaxID=393481 RepID=A0A543KEQ3_9RHOB|nr:hypothetical protein [Roseinatronobacter monicus]TQM93555.1 hypothetical protein BD293_2192 [Roseinatronobacter monicus]
MTEKPEEYDVEGLLRKNAELLNEVKELKAKLADAQGAEAAALQAVSDAQATVRKVTLETPLEGALGGCFVAPWRVVRPLLDEHFTFDMGADGVSEIKTLSGEVVALDGLMQHVQTIPDLAAMLRPPSGGGASGGNNAGRVVRSEEKPEPKPKVASPFGIR